MRAGRPERHAVGVREREQAPAVLALAFGRVPEVLAGARDDLDLRGDQLARHCLAQAGVGSRRSVELLEARDQVQRARIEDRELLLQADREVGGFLESVGGAVEVDGSHRWCLRRCAARKRSYPV